eukprot:scaffold340_cov256-Pinguiococcus_pyrenoidosus.AAC.45
MASIYTPPQPSRREGRKETFGEKRSCRRPGDLGRKREESAFGASDTHTYVHAGVTMLLALVRTNAVQLNSAPICTADSQAPKAAISSLRGAELAELRASVEDREAQNESGAR